jgi:hypothetical protein
MEKFQAEEATRRRKAQDEIDASIIDYFSKGYKRGSVSAEDSSVPPELHESQLSQKHYDKVRKLNYLQTKKGIQRYYKRPKAASKTAPGHNRTKIEKVEEA